MYIYHSFCWSLTFKYLTMNTGSSLHFLEYLKFKFCCCLFQMFFIYVCIYIHTYNDCTLCFKNLHVQICVYSNASLLTRLSNYLRPLLWIYFNSFFFIFFLSSLFSLLSKKHNKVLEQATQSLRGSLDSNDSPLPDYVSTELSVLEGASK